MTLDQWKDLVAGLPCVATWLIEGRKVYGQTELHHPEDVRDGLSEWLIVPLSYEMHRGPNGIHGLHRRGFYNRYKLTDLELVAGTLKLAAQADFGRYGIGITEKSKDF